MTEKQEKPRQQIKPVILVDEYTMLEYSDTIRRLMVGLASQSFKPALIGPTDLKIDILSSAVEVFNYPAIPLPFLGRYNMSLLTEKLVSFKPDVIHCFTPDRLKLAAKLTAELNIPFVATMNTIKKAISRSVIASKYCRKIIASTPVIKKQLEASHPRHSDKIVQINLGTFVNDNRACYNNNSRLVSMIISQPLINKKHFEPLLNAVRQLAIDGYEFVLAIIGKGPAAKAIHDMITALGLSQVVTMVGKIHPLRDIFSGADIFIKTHVSKDVSYNLLEAMSVGMAIASCHEHNQNFVIQDQTACCFNPYDEVNVYNCLKKLLDQRDYAVMLARNGQEYLRQHYTVSYMTEKLMDVYRQAVAQFKNTPQGGSK